MQQRYKVFSATPDKVAVQVPYEGGMINAQVDGLIVEVVTEDGRMSHTLRIVPSSQAELATAAELFTVDAFVTATWARAVD